MSQESSPTPDEMSARMDRMEGSLRRIEEMLERASGAMDSVTGAMPGALATFVDIADDLVASARARGLDPDAALRSGAALLGRAIEVLQAPEMARLIQSNVLSGAAVDLCARLGDEVMATARESGDKAGMLALFRAMRDPDVQRALDFAIRLLRRLGRVLDAHRTEIREIEGQTPGTAPAGLVESRPDTPEAKESHD